MRLISGTVSGIPFDKCVTEAAVKAAVKQKQESRICQEEEFVKKLSVAIAGLLVSDSATAVHADMLNGQHVSNDSMNVAFQYSGRWVDQRASMKRPNREKTEIAVIGD